MSTRSTVDGQKQQARSDAEKGIVRLFIASTSDDKESAEKKVADLMVQDTGDIGWNDDTQYLHLNADVPYIVLHGKGDKYRNVPILEKTKKHLLAYLCEFHMDSDKREPLFYATMNGQKHSLSSDTLENLIRNSAKTACNKGIEMPTRCHCHMIRKTRAMDLYQSGVPLTHIQQLLGHEDISTTSGFYAFATLNTLSTSMAKADASSKDEKLWKDPKTLKRLYRL